MHHLVPVNYFCMKIFCHYRKILTTKKLQILVFLQWHSVQFVPISLSLCESSIIGRQGNNSGKIRTTGGGGGDIK